MGEYRGTAEEPCVPYIQPLEKVNKTEERWATIPHGQGTGLLAVGVSLLNLSRRPYPLQALTRVHHTLASVPSSVVCFYLDHVQTGLGSRSCKPGPLSLYRLASRDMASAIRLQLFALETTSAIRPSRQQPEQPAAETSS